MKTADHAIKFSIKIKFIIGIALLVGLIIIMNSINTSLREESLLTTSMDESGLLLSTTLAIACQDPIISQAYESLVPYTERIIVGGQDIQEIAILDIDGRYLAHRLKNSTDSLLGELSPNPCARRLKNSSRHNAFFRMTGNLSTISRRSRSGLRSSAQLFCDSVSTA